MSMSDSNCAYTVLAPYYDLLINDPSAQARYVQYVRAHVQKKASVLELACGSGYLANQLSLCGYDVLASDLSCNMIAYAKKQYPTQSLVVMDMCNYRLDKQFDAILCFADSLNYVLEEVQLQRLFALAYEHLQADGVFLFDAHSMDRLAEFSQPYDEANVLEDIEYTWTIASKEHMITQTLRIWDDAYIPPRFIEENHVQRVYEPAFLLKIIKDAGFDLTTVTTDFDQEGICAGEKQFYCCRKGRI